MIAVLHRKPVQRWLICAALAAAVMASFGPTPEQQTLTGLLSGVLIVLAGRALITAAARTGSRL